MFLHLLRAGQKALDREKYLIEGEIFPDRLRLLPHLELQVSVHLLVCFPADMASQTVVFQGFHGGQTLLVAARVFFELGKKSLLKVAHFELIVQARGFNRFVDSPLNLLRTHGRVLVGELDPAQGVVDD